MRKIYSVLMALATAVMTFTSCSESNDAYFTATEDDYPRILNTDIPEASAGGRAVLPAITRDNNFKFDVIVTPAEYTTVTWLVDGQQVYEGKSIDYSLIAGTYDVDIVATTTKGKSTMRQCTLEVLPLDTDPAIAQDAKSLWCQIGTVKVISVTNFADVRTLYIGGQKIDFKNDGSSITFTVPSLAEGNQKVVVETVNGVKFGCGNVNITTEKWVDPGVIEIVAWEGESAKLSWTAWEDLKETWAAAGIEAGATIVVYVSADEGAEGAITTSWWNDINTGKQWEEAGLKTSLSGDCTMEYTVESIDFLAEQGFAVVGNGFVVKKVVVRKGGSSLQVIWEGESAKLAWNAWEDLKDTWADAGIAAGKKITVYVTADEGAEGAITTSWWKDINTGAEWEDAGLKTSLSGDCTMEYTVQTTDFLVEQGFAVVGNGFVVKRVTIE